MSSVHISEYNWGVLLELIYLIILSLISSISQHILLRIKENPQIITTTQNILKTGY